MKKATPPGRLVTAGIAVAALLLAAVPVIALSVPPSVRIPPAKAHPAGAPAAAALFSHQVHAAYQCYACHPGLFPQEPLGFTHGDMAAGRYCGGCHEGKRAPAVAGYRCEVCHAPK